MIGEIAEKRVNRSFVLTRTRRAHRVQRSAAPAALAKS